MSVRAATSAERRSCRQLTSERGARGRDATPEVGCARAWPTCATATRPLARRAGEGAALPALPEADLGDRRSASASGDSGAARSTSTRATRRRVFVVVRGRVKISCPSDAGDEAILATLRPGDFFGALALLDGAPRSASATALDRSRRWSSRASASARAIDTVPASADALFELLAKELRRITDHVEELHFLDMTGRLAARLTRLADEQGVAGEDGCGAARRAVHAGRPRVDGRLDAAVA